MVVVVVLIAKDFFNKDVFVHIAGSVFFGDDAEATEHWKGWEHSFCS